MAFDSLYTGISGLDSYQSWIDMISNNIANTATQGFKAQRMTFADQFYQQVGSPSGPTQTSGGVDPQDLGLGVKVATVDTEFGQGGLQTTGINTDLALNGDGFFILNNANGTGSPTYTRNGAFSLNSNGLFYDPSSGQAVMGYMANGAGVVTPNGTPGAITIPVGLAEQATATGSGVKTGPAINDQVFDVGLGGNLDQTNWSQAFQQAIGASANPGAAVTVSTTMYDSLGGSHEATITYTPVAPGASAAVGHTRLATPGLHRTASTVAPATSAKDTITVTAMVPLASRSPIPSARSKRVCNDQTITVGGATFTLATGGSPVRPRRFTVDPAQNGLPTRRKRGRHRSASRYGMASQRFSFADGTQFQTLQRRNDRRRTARHGRSRSAPVRPAPSATPTSIRTASTSIPLRSNGRRRRGYSPIPERPAQTRRGTSTTPAPAASLQQGNQLNVTAVGSKRRQ